MLRGESRVEVHVARLDGQGPTRGHGVSGVDGQVQDNLLHLHGISEHVADVGSSHQLELDVLANQAPQHRLHGRDHHVQIQDVLPHDLLATEGQQLSGQ